MSSHLNTILILPSSTDRILSVLKYINILYKSMYTCRHTSTHVCTYLSTTVNNLRSLKVCKAFYQHN